MQRGVPFYLEAALPKQETIYFVQLRLSFHKNELFSAKFAYHENNRVMRLINMASTTTDMKDQ